MDISLYYQETGEGAPFFLLHGKRNMEMLGLMVHEPNIDLVKLHAIQSPTLVIAGTRDMIKKSHTKLIAANIPDAKLAIVKGTHFIANKRSAEFNKEVEKFLQTIE